MNNKRGFSYSKDHDRALVAWLNKNSIKARLATEDEDRREKWDVLVTIDKDYHIDTKYPSLRPNPKTGKMEIWFEYTKLCGPATRKVDQLWYFIRDNNHKIQIMLNRDDVIKFLSSKYDSG